KFPKAHLLLITFFVEGSISIAQPKSLYPSILSSVVLTYSSQVIIVFHGVTVPEQFLTVPPTLVKSTACEAVICHNFNFSSKLISKTVTPPGTCSELILRYPLVLLPLMGTYPVKSFCMGKVPPAERSSPASIIF